MIEKIVNSKIRIKLLNLFLSHIDDRYYLRELERMMGESLSPLRRQLVKLTDAGVLIVEEEANLKYYRINKNFEGLERLKNLVIGGDVSIKSHENTPNKIDEAVLFSAGSVSRQFRYDLVVLFFVSVFVLTTAMFVVHLNSKNMKIFSSLIMKNSRGLSSGSRVSALGGNGEMTSGKWKITPGDASVFSAVSINKAEKPEKL